MGKWPFRNFPPCFRDFLPCLRDVPSVSGISPPHPPLVPPVPGFSCFCRVFRPPTRPRTKDGTGGKLRERNPSYPAPADNLLERTMLLGSRTTQRTKHYDHSLTNRKRCKTKVTARCKRVQDRSRQSRNNFLDARQRAARISIRERRVAS